MLSESQKAVVEEVTRRIRDELREVNVRVVELKVEDIDEYEVETIEKVRMFMEENTMTTEKKTDVLGTTDLYNKYVSWNQKKNQELYPNKYIRDCVSINYVENSSVFGKHLTHMNYTQWKAKRENKTIRGFGYMKYRDGADNSVSVKEYMEKYTERTGSVKDRIAIRKLLPKFYKEHSERYSQETFKNKLLKYGYHTKAAKETQRVKGRYGQEKIIKVGEEVPCVLKVRLKDEFFREEWTQ